jgi:transketolase C-terminal domain/subunit
MGNLRLPPLFGDRAVFPRGIPISVFGESEAEGDVLFSLPDGEERRAHFVPEGGKFSVLLDGVDRYAEEGCLTVTSAGETCVARHISVGIVLLEELTDTDSIVNCGIIPQSARAVLFAEEGVRCGGAGMMIFDNLSRAGALDGKATSILAIEDAFVRGKKGESIKKTAGICADDIISEVKRLLSR